MSTLKVDSIESRTSGARVTLPDLNFLPPYRNIIINGDMSIAQRGTSSAGITTGGYHACDRFRTSLGTAGTWTISQDTDVPTGQGFAKSLKLDCTTANGSLSSDSELVIRQMIEGQNLQYLKKGTSSAESLTISFWVKSNKTGTYIVEIDDNDNSRNINKSYTIDASNTWEKKTITFDGDTTGTLDNDNNASFRIMFWLAAGSDFTTGTLATSWESTTNANRAVGQVNLADSTSNDWYITGVQLEAGDSATPFEHLPYDVNLQRCYRYYEEITNPADSSEDIGIATAYSSVQLEFMPPFKVTKRSVPTVSLVTGTDYFEYLGAGATTKFDGFPSGGNQSINNGMVFINTVTVTQSSAYRIRKINASGRIAFTAEL